MGSWIIILSFQGFVHQSLEKWIHVQRHWYRFEHSWRRTNIKIRIWNIGLRSYSNRRNQDRRIHDVRFNMILKIRCSRSTSTIWESRRIMNELLYTYVLLANQLSFSEIRRVKNMSMDEITKFQEIGQSDE